MPDENEYRIDGFEGRVAIVTGSTKGIGRAIAEELARYGVNVVITSRHLDQAQAVADEIGETYGIRTLAQRTDVSKLEEATDCVEATLEWSGGRLDIVVCNAGYPLRQELWETPLHQIPPGELDKWFDAVYDVDLKGSRWMTYAALPVMVRHRSGALIYISSTPALAGYKGTPYTEAKAGILGLMRDVAVEYGRYNVRANAVAPGNIRTEWYDSLSAEQKQTLAKEAPLQRWGDPRDIAGAVLFLASPLSSFMTGQTLVVDGGTVIR